ncbi:MAG: hypothetical protein P4M02_05325 [Clostridia bacterium]|nr:hypothetical protein [Clostridia bacterium]
MSKEIAEWKDYGDGVMSCSHCGYPALYYPYRRKVGREQCLSKYCPTCGAHHEIEEDKI